MSRSNKTWGNSRNALNNRLQQSRIARNLEPAPTRDVEVDPFPEYAFPIRLDGVRPLRGGNIQIRTLDGGLEPNVIVTDYHFDARAYQSRVHKVAQAVRNKKARVPGERVFVAYPYETPLNPVNLKSVTDSLVRCVETFLQSGEWDGPSPMGLVPLLAEERKLYAEQLQKWCAYLVRKHFLPNRRLHYPVTVKVDSKNNILGWFKGGMSVAMQGSPSRAAISGFKDISYARGHLDPWATNVEVYTNPHQRPTWLTLGDLFDERGDSYVAISSKLISYGAAKVDVLTGNNLFVLYPRMAFAVKNPDPLMRPLPDNFAMDIMRCAVGFWINKEFTRPWSDFDVTAYAKASYEQYLSIRMKHYVRSSNALIKDEFYSLGEYLGKEYALVPLRDSEVLAFEGKMMAHCVTNRTHHGSDHRFYSIREAERVDGTLVLGRPRITFDLSISVNFHRSPNKVPFTMNPRLGTPLVTPEWVPNSIKGIRNMNNPKWLPLLEAAGRLLDVPTLASHYRSTKDHLDDES